MSVTGRILIVDDDEAFLGVYQMLLAREGWETETASTPETALARLDSPDIDVVLLDRKFHGVDRGADLLAEARSRAPLASVLIVTGYADPDFVRRVLREGAYDVMEKNSWLEVALPIKIRHMLEIARERRMVALVNGEREKVIREYWKKVRTETDRHRKGKILEDLLLLIFKSIQGFERATVNRKAPAEEFDVVIPNESSDPFWSREAQYLLIECKNWSTKIEREHLDALLRKLEGRFGRSKTGFFVSVNGFSEGFEASRYQEARSGGALVVPIDGADLEKLVESTDRNATLKALHERAVLGSKS